VGKNKKQENDWYREGPGLGWGFGLWKCDGVETGWCKTPLIPRWGRWGGWMGVLNHLLVWYHDVRDRTRSERGREGVRGIEG